MRNIIHKKLTLQWFIKTVKFSIENISRSMIQGKKSRSRKGSDLGEQQKGEEERKVDTRWSKNPREKWNDL